MARREARFERIRKLKRVHYAVAFIRVVQVTRARLQEPWTLFYMRPNGERG